MTAEAGIHLSGHGGTNDGIIGATAAVGLTACGWSARFLEYGCGFGSARSHPCGRASGPGYSPRSTRSQCDRAFSRNVDHHQRVAEATLLGGQAILPVQYHYGRWVAVGKERCPFAHIR